MANLFRGDVSSSDIPHLPKERSLEAREREDKALTISHPPKTRSEPSRAEPSRAGWQLAGLWLPARLCSARSKWSRGRRLGGRARAGR